MAAKKAEYDKQLQAGPDQAAAPAGSPRRLPRVGARRRPPPSRRAAAEASPQAGRPAEEAAAAASARENASGGHGNNGGGGGGGGYVRPTGWGYISSCYGWALGGTARGRRHGRPDRNAGLRRHEWGIVQRTGPATGFGLAIYIRGDDGAVTVYGHVNREFVSAGQRVTTGQQIAEVGDRGQLDRTAPALRGAPRGATCTAGRTDPVPWLRGTRCAHGGLLTSTPDRPGSATRGSVAGPGQHSGVSQLRPAAAESDDSLPSVSMPHCSRR